jgi:SpoVK/Ycf46/Vps4 family AAA+-type ATPase
VFEISLNVFFAQILEAVGRKIALAESVDLEEIARATDGFSGADLQALVYNAQLEIIHEAISASATDDTAVNGDKKMNNEDPPIEYMVISGPDADKAHKSRAEEAAFQKRVSSVRFHGKCSLKLIKKLQLRRIMASDHITGKTSTQRETVQAPQVSRQHLYSSRTASQWFSRFRSRRLPRPICVKSYSQRARLSLRKNASVLIECKCLSVGEFGYTENIPL